MGKRGQAKPKGLRGPSDKFKPEVSAQILAALSLGLSRKQACHVAGISRRLFSAWRKQGLAAPGGLMGQFAKDVRAAESRGIAVRLSRITAAGASDWRADAWYLEHVFAEQFARTRVDHSHSVVVARSQETWQESLSERMARDPVLIRIDKLLEAEKEKP